LTPAPRPGAPEGTGLAATGSQVGCPLGVAWFYTSPVGLPPGGIGAAVLILITELQYENSSQRLYQTLPHLGVNRWQVWNYLKIGYGSCWLGQHDPCDTAIL